MKIAQVIISIICLHFLVSCTVDDEKACLDLIINVEGMPKDSVTEIGTLRLITDPMHLTGEKPIDTLPPLDLLFNNLKANGPNVFQICGLPKRKFYVFLDAFVAGKEYIIKRSVIVDLTGRNTKRHNYSFVISQVPERQNKF